MNMRIAKLLARVLLPASFNETFQAVRSRKHQLHLLEKAGIHEATARFVDRHGSVVRYGPFVGTIYPLEAALSQIS